MVLVIINALKALNLEKFGPTFQVSLHVQTGLIPSYSGALAREARAAEHHGGERCGKLPIRENLVIT